MRVILLLCVFSSACTSHAVRCDGHLRSINAPLAGADASPTAGRSK